MDLYEWIWTGIVLSLFGVPFAIGLCVANPRTAILLALASFCGLYAIIWSALGPLFVPARRRVDHALRIVGHSDLELSCRRSAGGACGRSGVGTQAIAILAADATI